MQLNESFHPQSPAVRIGFWLLEAFDFILWPMRWSPCAWPTKLLDAVFVTGKFSA